MSEESSSTSMEEEMSEESSSTSMEEEMSEESSSTSMEEEMSEESSSMSMEEEMSEEEETERRQKKTALKRPKCKKIGMTPTEVEELETIDNVKNFIKCVRKCNKNEDCEAWRFCKNQNL